MYTHIVRRINTGYLVIICVFCLICLILSPNDIFNKLKVNKKNEIKITKSRNTVGGSFIRDQIDEEHLFKEYKDKEIVTLHDICIENEEDGKLIEISTNHSVVKKRLVVYGATKKEIKTITVAHTSNRPHGGKYKIHYKPESIPKDYTFIVDYPAYFTVPSCTANLHHFWADSTEGLYKTMKHNNRLGSKIPNQLYYQDPIIKTPFNGDCNDIHRYEDILFTFPVRRFHDTYHAEKHGVCYENAVFGYLTGNSGYKLTIEANHHIYKGMNITYEQCGAPSRVTIIQRHQRRLLNLDELVEASKSAGYENTQTVTFEELKLVDQMRAAYCSDVLVGIQGAGLRWIQYMRPHTAFLEIGWKNWKTKYYKRFGKYQQIKSIPIVVPNNDVHINWTSYSLQVRNGKPVSEEERIVLLNKKPKDHRDNQWKWADVKLPVDLFLQNIKPLYQYALSSEKN